MNYRSDKLMINGHTDTHTHIHTHAGNDNTRRPKLASGKNALRDVRLQPEHEFLPPEVAYADDVDFISMTEYRNVDDIQKKLQSHQLNITDKNEYTGIERQSTRDDESWLSIHPWWWQRRWT